MAETDPVAVKDKSTRLVILGILDLILGLLCALPVVVMGASDSFLDINILFLALTVILLVLGIGSIMKRRWSRTLMLIFSWTWLVTGISVGIFYIFTLPKMFEYWHIRHPSDSPDQTNAMIIAECIFFFIFYILFPLLFLLLYGSKKVKTTVEQHDPTIRWTDKNPLSVTTLYLWLVLSAFLGLLDLFTMNVVYCFGYILTGVLATVINVGLIILWLGLARFVYLLDLRGWYGMLMTAIVLLVSYLVSYWKLSIVDLYSHWRRTGMEIELARKYETSEKIGMFAMMGFSALILLGLIFYVRRYFHKRCVSEMNTAGNEVM